MAQQVPILPYRPYQETDDTLQIEYGPDTSVTITVPTRRSASRFVGAAASADVLALVLAPLLWLFFTLLATRKPRAILRLTATELHIRQTNDDGLGLRCQTRSWALTEIGELRPNRFESGLWITIRGKDSFNLLADLPPSEIEAIARALSEARQRFTEGGLQ